METEIPQVRSLPCTLNGSFSSSEVDRIIMTIWHTNWHTDCHSLFVVGILQGQRISAEVSYTSQVLLLWSLKLNAHPYLALKSIRLDHVYIWTIFVVFYTASVTSVWCINNTMIVRNSFYSIMCSWKENPETKLSGSLPLFAHFFLIVIPILQILLAFLSLII